MGVTENALKPFPRARDESVCGTALAARRIPFRFFPGRWLPLVEVSLVKSGILGLCAGLLLLMSSAHADDARQRLDAFFDTMQTFSARFEQVVLSDRGEIMQTTEGQMYLRRPGQFRWDYEQPYRQQIVADGQVLWTYDEDLAQATAQDMTQALSHTPMMLLAGSAPLDETFLVNSEGSRDGLVWLELRPRVPDTDFDRLLLGLDGQLVRMMVLHDQFGNETRIYFREISLNGQIPPERFRFEPPPGVDVMRN